MHMEDFQEANAAFCQKVFIAPRFYENLSTRGLRIHDKKVVAKIIEKHTNQCVAYLTEEHTGAGTFNAPLVHNYKCYCDKELLMELLLLKGGKL